MILYLILGSFNQNVLLVARVNSIFQRISYPQEILTLDFSSDSPGRKEVSSESPGRFDFESPGQRFDFESPSGRFDFLSNQNSEGSTTIN